MITVKGEYFYGNKISDYGLKNKRVDYATLAKSFDAVLNNNIFRVGWELGEWYQECGFPDNSERIEELKEELENLNDKLDTLEEESAEYARTRDYIDDIECEISELESGEYTDPEIFQWYIVDGNAVEILEEANEIVYYNEALDMYVWGVTHWGTSWSYVLTDIVIED